MAWETVKAKRGSGGVDGQSLDGLAAQLDQQLDRLHRELKDDVYRPQPVRQVQIPKAGKPGEFRTLGIPTIYDRVCQQALLNRLESIFEPVFDEANFGYRRGRSTKDAMRKVWKEIQGGREWIVDADWVWRSIGRKREELAPAGAGVDPGRFPGGGPARGRAGFCGSQTRSDTRLLSRHGYSPAGGARLRPTGPCPQMLPPSCGSRWRWRRSPWRRA